MRDPVAPTQKAVSQFCAPVRAAVVDRVANVDTSSASTCLARETIIGSSFDAAMECTTGSRSTKFPRLTAHTNPRGTRDAAPSSDACTLWRWAAERDARDGASIIPHVSITEYSDLGAAN